MRATLALLLLAAAVCAAQAANTAGTSGRRLLQTPTTCPIANCKDAASCIYDSAKRSWTCRVCKAPFVPNAAKNACVCPAGQYPVAGGTCALCKLNFYCPLGTNPLRSTATRCPANMVTVKRGAASINDCLNAPGFRYLKTVSSVRAVSCGNNEYSVGLAKQTACNKCPPGFETDPDNAPGQHTSSGVCLAPPGKFVTGESTSPCPVGEFSDSYSNDTSCTTCEEALGSAGVTTANSGSTSKAYCNWPMPGYILLDDKKKVITAGFNPDPSDPEKIVSGAKLCPQSYYCQGGDPNIGNPGVPVKCFTGLETDLARLWTEKEGATSITQCVAPPGHYLDGTVKKCPADSYKEGFGSPATCTKCGSGLWVADENSFFNQLDAYGAVRKSWGTRGSPDVCYIQQGMGAVRNGAIGGAVNAILCPANTYGVVDKKYGVVVTPCTPCPTNMVTANADGTDATIRAQSYMAVTLSTDTTTTSTFTTAGTSFFSVAACLTQAGYGYYNGASQQCPKGWYNDEDNTQPCKQCPYGTTTAAVGSASVSDCSGYLAGYGLVNGVTDLCPIGTYQVEDGTGACEPCSSNHWTPAPGGVENYAATPAVAGSITCNLCKPGYYSTDGGADCNNACQDGYFCPATRTGSDVSATACPSGRTYTYTWETTEVYEPPATSVIGATTPDDCVALFAQTMDQSSFLDLPYSGATAAYTPVIPGASGLDACTLECLSDTYKSTCMGVTFSYNGTEPECRLLLTVVEDGTIGFAFKTMPSTNLAQSKTGAKAMGTGFYTYWHGRDNAALNDPDVLGSTNFATTASATTIALCETVCTEDPLCAGIKYTGYSAPSTIAGCFKLMSSSAINTNRRTLLRAVYTQIGAQVAPANPRTVPPGFYWTAAGAFAVCTEGYACAGVAASALAATETGRSPCTAGTYAPAGSASCTVCPTGTYSAATAALCTSCPPGSTSTTPPTANCALPAGKYWTAAKAVAPCPPGSQCAPGATRIFDPTAVGPQTTATACGANQYSAAGATSCTGCPTDSTSSSPSATCDLAAPKYWDGDSVENCPAGSYCAGTRTFNPLSSAPQGATACTPLTQYSAAGATACSNCPTPGSTGQNPASAFCVLDPNYVYTSTAIAACTAPATYAGGGLFTVGGGDVGTCAS